MPSRRGGHNQHLRSQKFKHICFVSRGSSGGAVSGRTLTSLLRCIPNLTVAWFALGLPGGKRLCIHLGGLSARIDNLVDDSGVSMQKLASFTQLKDSVVVFSGFDGFSTEIVSLLPFLKRCNPDCMFVWMLRGDVVVNDNVSNRIHRLDIYLNQPQFRSGDHIDTFFRRLEEIKLLLKSIKAQMLDIPSLRGRMIPRHVRRNVRYGFASWLIGKAIHFTYNGILLCQFCGLFFTSEKTLSVT